MYYRAIVIITAWDCHKNSCVDQWNKIEDPDIILHTFGNLNFDNGARTIQGRKESIFKHDVVRLDRCM